MKMQNDYQKRRLDLARSMPSNSVAVIPAANEILRNGDSHYRFRQDSDFYYLTGCNEPDALLLITAGSDTKSILFNRERSPALEQWTGVRIGQEGARELLGVDEAYPLSDVAARLPEFLAGKHAVYQFFGRSPAWEKVLFAAWHKVKGQARKGISAPLAFCDLAELLGEMRLFKSQSEIALMREAARMSVMAHQRAMRACSKAQTEYQLEAELWYELTRQGSRGMAYDPIVAGGNRACTLHYTDNNKPLKPGDLVLIDAGGECDNYAADITRTFPLNGRFSPEQRLIYEAVLRAQKAGIACVKPGCLWDTIQKTIVRSLTSDLVDLGILHGEIDGLIEQEAYKSFYMHNSGHWLGLDVHDCGAYKKDSAWRELQPGMVLTVEPGLYISEQSANVDSRWQGIGVRIEDDILVTEDGFENLTAALVVDTDAIEAFLRG